MYSDVVSILIVSPSIYSAKLHILKLLVSYLVHPSVTVGYIVRFLLVKTLLVLYLV